MASCNGSQQKPKHAAVRKQVYETGSSRVTALFTIQEDGFQCAEVDLGESTLEASASSCRRPVGAPNSAPAALVHSIRP
jgi:hypothetical protein